MRKNWRMSSYKRDILQQNTSRSQQTAQAISYSVSQEIRRLTGLFASIGMDRDVMAKLYEINRRNGVEKQLRPNVLISIKMVWLI
jgi:two-component system, sensor histidine kinase YesM